MKKFFVVFISCLFGFCGYSQFSFFTIMPSPVASNVFGDTLLNSSAILKREGIRKVIAVETSTQRRIGSSFTTTYVVSNGQIQTRSWCYRPAPDTAFRFCHMDTLFYTSKGQLKEYRAMAGQGVPYLRNLIDYNSEGETLTSWITFDLRNNKSDTTTSRRYYNEKGQLIRQMDNEKNRTTINCDLFYNEDGLLDSIRHENPSWGTYVFNRKKKGKKKEITLETERFNYRWLYNEAGQCIAMSWAYNKSAKRYSKPLLFDITYSYNDDGTLKKVAENKGEYKVTTVYSYEK